MKNKDYWTKRTEQISNLQFVKADKLNLELSEAYQKTLDKLQQEIYTFYAKYANVNGLTYEGVKMILSETELNSFRISLEEYKELAMEKVNEQYLDSMYIRSRISRIEALKTQIQANIRQLGEQQDTTMKDVLNDVFSDTYHRTVFEIENDLGFHTNFSKFNEDQIKTIVSKPWLEGNFSDRLWADKEKLIRELETVLTQNMIAGKSSSEIADIFSKRMAVSFNNSKRLINTETSFICEQATLRAYKETGVEKYEILATLDLRTSDICREMDGKIFKLSEASVGVTLPPFHVNCRSTTIPVILEEFDQDSKRIAVDPVTGRKQLIDKNVTYKKWLEDLKKNYGEEKITIEKKKIDNLSTDKEQYERYKDFFGNDKLPRTIEEYQNFKYNKESDYSLMKSYYVSNSRSVFPEDLTYDIYKSNLTTDNWQAVGFNPLKLDRHISRHGEDFNMTDKYEYQKAATAFMNKQVSKDIEGFTSKNGFVFRYDKVNNIFGDSKPNGITETYFKPKEGYKYWKEQKEKYGR